MVVESRFTPFDLARRRGEDHLFPGGQIRFRPVVELRPFIQVIDSFDNNEKLGIGFEARVGGGRLLVLAVDTRKKLDERPATRQLLESIDKYVRSDRFDPQVELDESFIRSFVR